MVDEAAIGPNSMRNRLPAHNWGWFLFRGIVAVILGILAVLMPLSALFAFTLVFAAYALVDGIAALISGLRGASTHRERWGALVFRGIVGILVGIVFLVMPMIATFSYAFVALVLLAFWGIVTGVLEIATAIRLRKEMEGEWLLGLGGLVSILLGIAIFVWVLPNPLATIISAAWIIAVYAFCAGIILIAQALRLKGKAPIAATSDTAR